MAPSTCDKLNNSICSIKFLGEAMRHMKRIRVPDLKHIRFGRVFTGFTTPLTTMATASLAAVLMTGCNNNCQDLCVEVKRFAESECGQEWSGEDLQECRDNHSRSNVPKETREACGEIKGSVEDEWTCDEVDDYFTGTTSDTAS